MTPATHRQNTTALRGLTLLWHFSADALEQMLRDGTFRLVSYGRGEILHLEGEPCRNLEVIVTGRVAVERIDADGRLLTVATFTADDLLGGNLLFSSRHRFPLTVTARDPTRILEIGR